MEDHSGILLKGGTMHFDSKSAVFRESVIQGVSDVVGAVQPFQAKHRKE